MPSHGTGWTEHTSRAVPAPLAVIVPAAAPDVRADVLIGGNLGTRANGLALKNGTQHALTNHSLGRDATQNAERRIRRGEYARRGGVLAPEEPHHQVLDEGA